ncbi:MAG: efflux RND transporter permease subunit [Desulfocapsaceae bacterium]|nr:efflux RND transporter permease subunit [Desulfocapsaceae bacterium]
MSNEQPKGVIAWMAHNSIAANLLMVILLAGGFWTALTVQKEVFPQFQLDIVQVTVAYPGAAPTEVEQGILRPVEEAIRGVEGIRELTSRAWEGSGRVTIELVAGADRMKVFQEIDQAVNRIRTFPEDVEEPRVRLQERRRDVMEIGLYGDVDIWELRKLAERLRDIFISNENITQVNLGNVPDYRTHIEIAREDLRQYNLTLADVANLVEASSDDIPAGAIETSAEEILLRVKERKQWADEFEQIVILSDRDGALVTLGDIATVRDGFEEWGFHSQFNQQPSVELNIYRVGSQSPLEIAEAVLEIMTDFERTLPEGVQWRIDSNNAEDFRERVSLVVKNGVLAIFIVMAILTLFLKLRLAFWIMMGMAISFIGGVLFMPMVDVSINMISLFGFLVVLGIVVDDAIVVGENIYSHQEKEENHLKAAIAGAKEMAMPVTFSILSNIIAFIPLLFIPGETGKFWGPLPVVVMLVLALSLFEALFILPAHLGHAPRRRQRSKKKNWFQNLQQSFARSFQKFIDTKYRRFLDFCLRFRYITLSAAIALVAIVGSYATSAHMGIIMMPEVAADEIEAGVRLPVGTTPLQAAQVAEVVTASTARMFEEHNLYEVAEGIKTNVRGQNFIDVEIVMRPPNERDMTAREVIQLWRDNIGELPGINQITFEAERGPGGWRQDISVDLSHSDIDTLEAASQEFLQRMEQYENTRDVNDNYNKGKTQLDFRLMPEGRALGLTAADLGAQLRGAFYGDLAMRQIRGTNEVEVRVKLPREQRQDIYNLEDLVLRTPDGAEVPLMDVAEVTRGEAFTSINRRDGRRIVNVSMDVEPKRAVGQVVEAINTIELPALREKYPGLTWTFEGSDAEMRRATASLWGWFGLAQFIIYALLAVAFRSYFQPLIVFGAIPFGIVGAVIGHIILGYDLSLVSLMGIIALTGVVVNDSLIMVTHANRQLGRLSPFEAIREAGQRRFRPIMLTTLTTFGGLSPIIFEPSLQAQYIIPMAISLGFGIIFATVIILVLVPCLYLVLEDVKRFMTEERDLSATPSESYQAGGGK